MRANNRDEDKEEEEEEEEEEEVLQSHGINRNKNPAQRSHESS